jgi:hypothetical protein
MSFEIKPVPEIVIPEAPEVPEATPSISGKILGRTSTTGLEPTAIGYLALESNTNGFGNTAIGRQALKDNTTGSYNTAVGNGALGGNISGSENVAIGREPLFSNVSGSGNTAIGTYTLDANTNGDNNVAIGPNACSSNTTGYSNVAIGFNALADNSSGSLNVAIGQSAGVNTVNRENNVMIGFLADSPGLSNTVTLGNTGITTLRCNVTSITSLSDERDKKDIQSLDYGLDLVNQIRPVQFEWDTRDGMKTGIKDIGFIAQELAEVEDAINAHDVLALTLRHDPEKLEASYGRLVPILVKAIQELSARLDALE